MKGIAIKLFIILTILTLNACGGGGGGGGETASTSAFSLVPLKSLSTGFELSFPAMTGSDSTGDSYTASVTFSNLPQTTYNLQPVTPRQFVLFVKNVSTGASVTGTGISYFAPGFIEVAAEYSTGVTCTPDSFTPPPDSAFIGDVGSLANYICTDGSTAVATWKLVAAPGGQAKFVVVESDFIGGILDTTEEDRYIIDEAGDIKSLEVSLYDAASGITINLAGNKQ